MSWPRSWTVSPGVGSGATIDLHQTIPLEEKTDAMEETAKTTPQPARCSSGKTQNSPARRPRAAAPLQEMLRRPPIALQRHRHNASLTHSPPSTTRDKPSSCLADIEMPEMNGMEIGPAPGTIPTCG